MAALDLLGRRWSLRVLWELRDAPMGARQLIARCAPISSSVLYERLRDLADAGLIVRNDAGDYALSETGAALGDAIAPLDAWSERWAAELATGRRP